LKFLGLKPIFWVLLIVFCVHVFVAAVPQNNMAWDEVYYKPSSVDALNGVASNLEHPPLVKLIGGASIGLFGDNWLAWRVPMVLFTVFASVMVYLIAKLFLSERLSLFAVVLMNLSLIFLYLGSLLILEMPFIAFGLAGVYFVLKGKYGLSGLMFGLSFLCKELAVVVFVPALIYLVVKKVNVWKILWFSAVGFLVAFFGLWIFELVYRPMIDGVLISDPVQHLLIMVNYQFNLNGLRNESVSLWTGWYPPVAWVSPFGENALNPQRWIWLTVEGRTYYEFMPQPNWAVEYLMFPLLVVLPVAYWLKRNSLALISWLCLVFGFGPWLLVGFFVRTEANFYVGASVPFLALGCVYLYSLIKNRRLKYALAITQLAVGLLCVIYYFPLPLIR
jgi:4-amino-4-deoxy-L-arabinose transferase-like glycosyltransferase